MTKYSTDKTRVSGYLKTDLVERLKDYADYNNISMTSAMAILLTQALDSADVMKTFKNISNSEELANAFRMAMNNVHTDEEVM